MAALSGGVRRFLSKCPCNSEDIKYSSLAIYCGECRLIPTYTHPHIAGMKMKQLFGILLSTKRRPDPGGQDETEERVGEKLIPLAISIVLVLLRAWLTRQAHGNRDQALIVLLCFLGATFLVIQVCQRKIVFDAHYPFMDHAVTYITKNVCR